jgi:hypothetical protein
VCVPSPPAPSNERRHGAHPCPTEADRPERRLDSRRARWLVRLAAALVATAGLLATGAVARASVAANDNYLDATPIFTERFQDTVETNEAGVQPDLFVPAAPGRPGGGNMPEPLACQGQGYGKTVWYDYLAPADGGLRVTASGFDAIVAVYEYDGRTARITRSLGCADVAKTSTGGLDIAAPQIKKGHRYAVQVGGVTDATGAAQSGVLYLGFQFLGDRDGDGVPDPNDACPDAAGPQSGCPPALPGTPRLAVAGLRIVQLQWAGLPAGAEVRARCARCGPHGISQTVRVGNGATARLTSFGRKPARRGAVLEVYARSPASGTGTARAAAIGKSARYRFGSGASHWQIACLAPGSWKKRVACPR